MRTPVVLSSVLIASMTALAAAQRGAKPSEMCGLRTAADITAVVGGPAGEPHALNLPMGKTGAAQIQGCMWGPLAGQGMVTYSVFPAAKGAEREQGLAKLREVTETLKTRGWKEDKKTFDGASCSLLTPPASEKDAPFTTGCIAEAKGMGISISYLGKKSLPIESVKALLDKLVARVP